MCSPELSDFETTIWQTYPQDEVLVIGITANNQNQIDNFVEDFKGTVFYILEVVPKGTEQIPKDVKDFIKSKVNEGWSDAKIQSSVKAKYGIDEIFKQSSTRKKSRGNRMGFLTSLKVCHTKYADFEGKWGACR